MVGRSKRSEAPRRALDVRLDRQRADASQRHVCPTGLEHDASDGLMAALVETTCEPGSVPQRSVLRDGASGRFQVVVVFLLRSRAR